MEKQEGAPTPQPSTSDGPPPFPAFQYLQELFSEGKISQPTLSKLKACYRHLQNKLKRAQESEVKLVEEAKRCRAQLEQMEVEVKEAEEQSTVEEPDTEVSFLRQQLFGALNELQAAEERDYKTQHQMQWLLEEKQFLESELRSKPTEPVVDIKHLKYKQEELKNDVALKQLEVSNLMKELETRDQERWKETKALEDKTKIINLKEVEKAQLVDIPEQIIRETEKKHANLEAEKTKMEAIMSEMLKMEQHLKEIDQANVSLHMLTDELVVDEETMKNKIDTTSREHRHLLRERDISREETVELTGQRGLLELKQHSLTNKKKHLFESKSEQAHAHWKQTQAVKRAEQALASTNEQLADAKIAFVELQGQFEDIEKEEYNMRRKGEIQREVDNLHVHLKQITQSIEDNLKSQEHLVIQDLLKESKSLKEEVNNLRNQIQVIVGQRGQRHRELLKAKRLNEHIEGEVMEKNILIGTHSKFFATLQRSLIEYVQLCELSTEERNRYVILKDAVSKAMAEISRQFKLLKNKSAIQTTILRKKDGLLKISQMKVTEWGHKRDKLRHDILKASWRNNRINRECEDNQAQLNNLRKVIRQQEDTLHQMEHNYQAATKRRTFLGHQILKKQEVLQKHSETVVNQEVAIANHNLDIETLEKEMKDVRLQIVEAKRKVDLKNDEMLVTKQLEEEITMFKIKLSEATDKTLESMSKSQHYKYLEGEDPSSVDLTEKLEQFRGYIAERDRQLMERQLLVNYVNRLTEPLGDQVKVWQDDDLTLAKKLNEVKAELISINNRMMVVSSELYTKEYGVQEEQQQVKEKEDQMEECQRRLEQGLPPHPEIEEEWRRMLRDKKRRQKDKEQRERIAEEGKWRRLPSGKQTTAKPRPDSYIPEDDPLPLPRPYGAFAPFKPTHPGASTRSFFQPSVTSLQETKPMPPQ